MVCMSILLYVNVIDLLIHYIGSAILKEKYDKMVDAINSGVVDETKATCKTNGFKRQITHVWFELISAMMEQWLIEGKFSQKEVLMLSCDMLAAGIDTVNLGHCVIYHVQTSTSNS